MYIAMNRFKVRPDEQEAFKTRWFDREVYLKTVPGFVAFHLLQGPDRQDHVLYASHTVWRSRADFEGWTRSEQFRAAHAGAGSGRSLTLTHPEFEGFEVLQEIAADGRSDGGLSGNGSSGAAA
jgi:heme-degrading monooxygenase HmoA